MRTPSTVTVVIPTVGRAELAEIVGAARAMPGVVQVVVVADRNVATVRELLAHFATDARVEIVPGGGLGSNWARETGAHVARGDVVLFLDDDVMPNPFLAAGHLRAHRERAGRVVLGYMPVAGDLRERSTTATIYGNDYEAACRRYEARPAAILTGLWAGNVSLRRNDCLRVGLASSWRDFEQQGDCDFGLRARRAGLVGHFDRMLVAEHRYVRTVPGFLRSSRVQACADATLRARYPEMGSAESRVAGMPTPARVMVWMATVSLVGPVLRRAVRLAAYRLGTRSPNRVTTGIVVVARAVEQLHALTRHDVRADLAGRSSVPAKRSVLRRAARRSAS